MSTEPPPPSSDVRGAWCVWLLAVVMGPFLPWLLRGHGTGELHAEGPLLGVAVWFLAALISSAMLGSKLSRGLGSAMLITLAGLAVAGAIGFAACSMYAKGM